MVDNFLAGRNDFWNVVVTVSWGVCHTVPTRISPTTSYVRQQHSQSNFQRNSKLRIGSLGPFIAILELLSVKLFINWKVNLELCESGSLGQ